MAKKKRRKGKDRQTEENRPINPDQDVANRDPLADPDGDPYLDLEASNASRLAAIDHPVYDDGTLMSDEATDVEADRIEDTPLGFVEVDTDDNRIEPFPLDTELADDTITIGTDPDEVMEQIAEFTDDPDILEDFAGRQQITSGSDQLLDRLRRHNSKTPELSGEDIDATWELADVSGEETVGSSTPTPDQDIVEELGEALGITYSDNEPLQTEDKLGERDRNRWELNPASMIEEDLLEEDLIDEDLMEEDLIEEDLADEELDEEDEDEIEALDELDELADLEELDELDELEDEVDEDIDDEDIDEDELDDELLDELDEEDEDFDEFDDLDEDEDF